MELYCKIQLANLSGLADTVADEIAFDLINQGMAEGLIQNGLKKLPRKMGLIEQLNLRPESLSGGQIQRLAIATAIATNPAVLIMDDPTSQMDPLWPPTIFPMAGPSQRDDCLHCHQ